MKLGLYISRWIKVTKKKKSVGRTKQTITVRKKSYALKTSFEYYIVD